MKAKIELDVPEWQDGKEVTVYFQDTMEKKGICKAEEAEADIEGGGMTWYFVCGECRTALPEHNAKYCPECGRKIKWT